jgi:DNA-binding response OmpR family regulator
MNEFIQPKILLICDNPDTGPAWAFMLQQKHCQVVLEASLDEAVQRWEQETPDLLVVDAEATISDLLNLVRQLRKLTGIPILLLPPFNWEKRLLELYQAGVDDCILKPVSPAMFLAKVNVWLHRGAAIPTSVLEPLSVGDYLLEPDERSLTVAGHPPTRLTNLEFRLMYVFMTHANRLITTDDLLRHVWGLQGGENRILLKNVIYRLRQKVEKDPTAPQVILTEGRQGYRFVQGG